MSKRILPGIEYPKVNEDGGLQLTSDITVQDYMKWFGDRTLITGGGITDNGNGTATVAAGTAWVKVTDADAAIGKFFSFSADNSVSLTDLITNYVYLDYNDGVPQIVVTTTSIITHGFKQDHIHIATIFRNGNTLHFHEEDAIGIGRINIADMHFLEMHDADRASGLVTTDGNPPALSLSVTTGVIYEGLNRHTTAVDGTTWSYWYTPGDSGATWTEETNQTALAQYYNDIDNSTGGTPGKFALGTGKYGVHWVYCDIDGENLFIIYGQGNYNANQAEEAAVPSVLPDIAIHYGVLIAKIINQEGTNTLTISYPWTSVFTSSLATDHGSLGGLGGDDHTQYILHSLADAANDFLVASGANTFAKQTLAQTLATISPLTTRGDMMFMNATVNTRLAKGNDNEILAMGASDPEWKTPATILSDIGAQPIDADLTSIALLGTAADKMLYTTNTDVWAEAAITSAGRSMVGAANAAAQLALMTTALKAELDLLDLAGLTAGELLVATGAATAAWQSTGVVLSAPDISGIVTAASLLTLPALKLGGDINGNAQEITALDRQNYNETNLLENGNFEVGDPPTGWGVEGADVTLAQSNAQKKIGSYSALVTRNGTDGQAFQFVANYLDYAGRKVTFGCWVWADTASVATLWMFDGVGAPSAVAHDGDSTWQWLTTSFTVDATPSYLKIYLRALNSDAGVHFDGAMLVEGDSCPAFSPKPIGTYDAITLRQKLTAGAVEIEGSAFDINGGTIDGATITAPVLDGTVTNTGAALVLPAFQAGGAIDMNSNDINNVAAPGAAGDPLIKGTRVTAGELPAVTDEYYLVGTGGDVEERAVPADLRVASGNLTAGAQHAKIFSWQNTVVSGDILVLNVIVDITTASTPAAKINAGGVATEVESDNMIDGFALNATRVISSVKASGTINEEGAVRVDDDEWVTGFEDNTAASTDLVGKYYIFYIPI